ncbi:hypothetical protein PLUTE_a4289 [Pseudoalteromonas luteoviolacea DSM 6061]|nr:hypothetical protein [Pseudoalteromonas luteoviolacea DSM 6061]
MTKIDDFVLKKLGVKLLILTGSAHSLLLYGINLSYVSISAHFLEPQISNNIFEHAHIYFLRRKLSFNPLNLLGFVRVEIGIGIEPHKQKRPRPI